MSTISSIDFPLVSGTKNNVNKEKNTSKTPNIMKL